MHYYLYEVKNILNNKIYVGVHKTKNLDDGYMGSGKVIRRAICKHGVDNFIKVIHETFENAEAMYAREKEIVDTEFLARKDTYNLRRGGQGGFDYINVNRDHHAHSQQNADNRDYTDPKYTKTLSLAMKESFKNPERKKSGGFKDKETQQLGNSPEARAKASITLKETLARRRPHDGKKNSQYGTMWITNSTVNKKIKKDDVIPSGWRKGRILK